jgi:hypothetical protein
MKKNTIIFLFIVLIAIVTAYVTCTDGGDFDCYMQAAKQISNRANIYQPPFVKDLQYFYSPFFALILSPFSNHIFLIEFIWIIFSYLLLYRIFLLVRSFFNIDKLNQTQLNIWLILNIFFTIQFVMYEVSLIQVTIFLLWATIESIKLLQSNKNIVAGLILALVINIKIMPILILPYLFYRGYFKSLIWFTLFFIAFLFVPALFIGNNYNNFLLNEWWNVINPTNKEHLFESIIGLHSIVALIPVYLTSTVGEMPYKRNFLNLQHHNVELIINIARLFFLVISLFFFRSLPFKKEKSKLKSYWEFSYFLMLIPLLLPHQNKYDFLFVLPMIYYIIYFLLIDYYYNKKINFFIIIPFLLITLFYSPIYGSDIIGWFLFRYTQHYRFLTIATILLIAIAVYCNPKKIEANSKY